MEEQKEKKVNFFTDENGDLSMRRLLAFIFGITSVGVCIGSVFFMNEWKTVLVGSGVPLAGSLLMMLFTSWGDVASVAKAVKGKD